MDKQTAEILLSFSGMMKRARNGLHVSGSEIDLIENQLQGVIDDCVEQEALVEEMDRRALESFLKMHGIHPYDKQASVETLIERGYVRFVDTKVGDQFVIQGSVGTYIKVPSRPDRDAGYCHRCRHTRSNCLRIGDESVDHCCPDTMVLLVEMK